MNLLSENLDIATGILVIGVNVLTNSLKISDVTKADFLQLNLSRIHEKRAK